MFDRLRSLPWWQKIILIFGCLTLLAHFTFSVARVGAKIGDYDINREFGRRFLAGEPLYQGGQCFNYMPASALYWAPLALVPPRVGMALRYLTALACLVITLRILHRIVSAAHRGSRMGDRGSKQKRAGDLPSLIFDPRCSMLIFATLILSIHYLIRDLDDGGPNLILLAVLLGGTYCIWQGRDILGALWLGLAIAVKLTPGLFLPFLLWKRKLRLLACSIAATFFWILLPAIWMGPVSWWRHQQEWNKVALSIFHDSPDLGRDGNEQRVQNQALKPALLRYMTTYPPGHPLRLEEADYVDFLNWPMGLANRAATGILLAIGAIFWWCTRRSWYESDWRIMFGEIAALLLLMLLFSPVTWLQHFVFAIPAVYWIVAEQQHAPRAITKWGIGAFAVLALLLNRAFLGRHVYLLLLSYHTHTLSLLVLLAMILARLSWSEGSNERKVTLEVLPPRGQAA
jgi:hypothetical protein